jgi:hypothetical protein
MEYTWDLGIHFLGGLAILWVSYALWNIVLCVCLQQGHTCIGDYKRLDWA